MSNRQAPGCLDRFYAITLIGCGVMVMAVLASVGTRNEPWYLVALVLALSAALILIGLLLWGFWERATGVVIGGVMAIYLAMGVAMLAAPEHLTTTGVRGPQTPAAALDLGFFIVNLMATGALWWLWDRFRSARARPEEFEILLLVAWLAAAGAHLWLTLPAGAAPGRILIGVVTSLGLAGIPIVVIGGIVGTRLTVVIALVMAAALLVSGGIDVTRSELIADSSLRLPLNSPGAIVGRGVLKIVAAVAIVWWALRRRGSSRDAAAPSPPG